KDHYKALDDPYECRNAKIPVIEECLLVRGVDEKIFFGTRNRPEQKIKLTPEELEKILSGEGLEQEEEEEELSEEDNETGLPGLGLVNIFSASSKSTSLKLNINTATAEQLTLLDGIDRNTALEIAKERKQRLYESKTDRLPQFENYVVWSKQIKVQKPRTLSYFKIKSRGFSPDGRISRAVTCNVVLTKSRCVISDWKAE
ncbi:MAG: general secretion pathway protein GspK, partial [Gammaproteobacteria bacterium]|nr:general secretion pathway protein GspK [Gammaproteobacteria bacterium]